MVQELKCRVCGASPTMWDKFYKQAVCSNHLAQRKTDAVANKHTEWLAANGFHKELDAVEQGDYDVSKINVESRGDEGIPGR